MKSSIKSQITIVYLSILATGLITGCAQIPELESNVTMKVLDTQYTNIENNTEWPNEKWWLRYKDSQLNHLITEALVKSPDMEIATSRLNRAKYSANIVESNETLQLNGHVSATEDKLSYNHLTPKNMTPQGFNDYGRGSIDLNWELDFWNKNKNATSAAKSEYYSKLAEKEQAKLLLTTSIVSNYIELHRLYAAQETTNKVIKIRTKTEELLKERYEHGLEHKGSVKQAESKRGLAETDLLKINEQIEVQQNKIASLMGENPERGLLIQRPTLELEKTYSIPTQIDLNLIGRRPDIVAAKWIVEAQLKKVEQKKKEFYPNINLMASIGLQSLGLNMLTNTGSFIGSFGPAISLPIFNTNRLSNELKGTHATYEETVAIYNKILIQALQEISDSIVSIKSTQTQIQSTTYSVQAAEEAYKIMNHRYKGGISSYIDVLATEDLYVNNLRLLSDLRARTFYLDTTLIKALGGGYIEDNIINITKGIN